MKTFVPLHLLSLKFRKLVEFHDVLDKIYCFIVKRKIPCTLDRIEKVYNELNAEIFNIEAVFSLYEICPEVYQLHSQNDGNNESIELIYALHGATSISHSNKRRNQVIETFSALITKHFISSFNHNASLSSSITTSSLDKCLKQIKTSGWPDFFDVEGCDIPTLSEKVQNMYEQYKKSKKRVVGPTMPDIRCDISFNSHGYDNGTGISGGSVTSPSNSGASPPLGIAETGGAASMVEHLKSLPFYKDQLVHVERIPRRDAVYADLQPPALPPVLLERLQSVLGLRQLYLHQARAIDALRQGRHAVVSTSTASGKSVIYNIPVLEAVLENPRTTALYLFPTKALAQDQLRSLLALTADGLRLPVSVAVCDGDTTQSERVNIQYPALGAANIVLTNPDMLHCTMLPEHKSWKRIYENIRFVVIDEAHLYRGAFGAHVAAVLRRLLRVCLLYGRSPQFLCCSATIANPAEHMQKLIPVHVLHPHPHHHPSSSSSSFTSSTSSPSFPSSAAPAAAAPAAAASTQVADEQATPEKKEHLAVSGGVMPCTPLLAPPVITDCEYLSVIGSQFDGAAQGERLFVLWNPPLQNNCSNSSSDDNMSDGLHLTPKADSSLSTNEKSTPSPSSSSYSSSVHKPLTSETTSVIAANINSIHHISKSGVYSTITKHNSASALLPSLSPSKRRFLQGCEEARPATIGPARDARFIDPHGQSAVPSANGDDGGGDAALDSSVAAGVTHPAWEVNYVGGWKRGRKSNSAVILDGAGSSMEEPSLLIAFQGSSSSSSIISGDAEQQVRRTSTIWETASLFTALVRAEQRTLAFCRVRKLVELVLSYSLRNLETSGAAHLVPRVASYRGGYTKEERREIESALFSGRLLGVTATCALELGIDVGALDATLHMGFPGTYSSLWQQAGRAGRSGRPSLSILVCFECPIDQYFARNPHVLFHSPVEPAVLDVQNSHILHSHLLCAAQEVPLNHSFVLTPIISQCNSSTSHGSSFGDCDAARPVAAVTDSDIWGARYLELVQYLVEGQKLVSAQQNGSSRYRNSINSANTNYAQTEWRACAGLSATPGKRYASSVSLRMIDPVTIRVLDDSRGGLEIDSLGYSRAFFELFEGAIYMHRAAQFLVHKLDLQSAVAHALPVKVKYYTSASNRTEVNIVKQLQCDGFFSCGTVMVVSSVYGFVKKWLGSGEIFEKGECTLPALEYETLAFWIDLPLRLKHTLEAERLCPVASMHAANHALLALSPLFAQCDAADLGTEHDLAHSALTHPFRMLIFDQRTGGLGACDAVFEARYAVLARAKALLQECNCTNSAGCPACTLDSKCTQYNGNLSKRGAVRLIELLLELQQERSGGGDSGGSDGNWGSSGLATGSCGAGAGGFMSYNATSANTDSGSSSSCCCTHTGAPASVAATASSHSVAPGSGTDPSPRKLNRQKLLKKAAYRDSSNRARNMAIQMNWTESVPTFMQENDK